MHIVKHNKFLRMEIMLNSFSFKSQHFRIGGIINHNHNNEIIWAGSTSKCVGIRSVSTLETFHAFIIKVNNSHYFLVNIWNGRRINLLIRRFPFPSTGPSGWITL